MLHKLGFTENKLIVPLFSQTCCIVGIAGVKWTFAYVTLSHAKYVFGSYVAI